MRFQHHFKQITEFQFVWSDFCKLWTTWSKNEHEHWKNNHVQIMLKIIRQRASLFKMNTKFLCTLHETLLNSKYDEHYKSQPIVNNIAIFHIFCIQNSYETINVRARLFCSLNREKLQFLRKINRALMKNEWKFLKMSSLQRILHFR